MGREPGGCSKMGPGLGKASTCLEPCDMVTREGIPVSYGLAVCEQRLGGSEALPRGSQRQEKPQDITVEMPVF